MLLAASHAIALIILTAAAIFDLKTTEVPDYLSVIGIVIGIGLHLAASIPEMNFSTLTNLSVMLVEPTAWLQALGDPLLWSIGAGTLFSIYGWGLYILGMWGGADAFAMSILGFAAPYSLSGPGIGFGLNIFVNTLLIGMVYALAYAVYISRGQNALSDTWTLIRKEEKRISIEIMGAGILSGIMSFSGFYISLGYFVALLSLIFLYRYLRVIQDDLMTTEVEVSELEPGDVLSSEEEQGGKVKGITEEEIDSIDKEKVEIRSGIKFVPVFPLALVLAELGIGGTLLVSLVLSL